MTVSQVDNTLQESCRAVCWFTIIPWELSCLASCFSCHIPRGGNVVQCCQIQQTLTGSGQQIPAAEDENPFMELPSIKYSSKSSHDYQVFCAYRPMLRDMRHQKTQFKDNLDTKITVMGKKINLTGGLESIPVVKQRRGTKWGKSWDIQYLGNQLTDVFQSS